jgi:hypothetical protein
LSHVVCDVTLRHPTDAPICRQNTPNFNLEVKVKVKVKALPFRSDYHYHFTHFLH